MTRRPLLADCRRWGSLTLSGGLRTNERAVTANKASGRGGIATATIGFCTEARRSVIQDAKAVWLGRHPTRLREHPPIDFDVVVYASIRVDRVQEVIISKDDPLITEEDRRNSATVGCEFGNLRGTGQHRWTIAREGHVRPVALEIAAACEETLLPFIEKYSDLRILHDTLAADGEEAKLIQPFAFERKPVVIALADLLRNL